MIHLLCAADALKGIFTHFPKKIDLVVALLFSSALSIFLFPSCEMCLPHHKDLPPALLVKLPIDLTNTRMRLNSILLFL